MADFRKYRVEFEGGVDTFGHKKIGNPPGYDAAIAREQVGAVHPWPGLAAAPSQRSNNKIWPLSRAVS